MSSDIKTLFDSDADEVRDTSINNLSKIVLFAIKEIKNRSWERSCHLCLNLKVFLINVNNW